MTSLPEAFLLKGKTMATVIDYAQQYLDEHWQTVWQEHLLAIEHAYAKSGDRAYAVYSRALFPPLENELRQAGVTCQQRLPGDFATSWEQGPQQERDRRFWSVLHLDNGAVLGTLVTHFFHDHTQLRIPRPAIVQALTETHPEAIVQVLRDMSDVAKSPARGGATRRLNS
jgi:hypothetical protein